MPFRYVDGYTPRGDPCLWLHVSGTVTLADAQGLFEVIKPGAPYHRQRVLSIVEKGVEYATDARKYMIGLSDVLGPQAAVVTSPLVRAGINLLTRVAGKRDHVRLFETEAEALAWLTECEV
jgi:hypothetical protein